MIDRDFRAASAMINQTDALVEERVKTASQERELMAACARIDQLVWGTS